MTIKEVEKFIDNIMVVFGDVNIELVKLRCLLMDAEESGAELENEKGEKAENLNMDKNKEDLVDWKLINDPGREKVHRFIECSACGMGVDVSSYTIQEVKEVFNFCPCCGQRMKLEVEWGQCSICKNLAKCWKERIARDGGRYCQQYEIIDSEGEDDNL